MKLRKQLFTALLALILVVSVFIIQALAVDTSVNLTKSQTYNLSGTIEAKQVYIKSTTSNSQSSTQRMRAQCQYKDGLFASWNYDVRVFIDQGKSLGSNKDSYKFATSVKWRLGLSPEVENDKGVTGSGTIVSK